MHYKNNRHIFISALFGSTCTQIMESRGCRRVQPHMLATGSGSWDPGDRHWVLRLVGICAINPTEVSKGLSAFSERMCLMLLEVNLVIFTSQSVGTRSCM